MQALKSHLRLDLGRACPSKRHQETWQKPWIGEDSLASNSQENVDLHFDLSVFCAQCEERVVDAMEATVAYEGRRYHKGCFACSQCLRPLDENKFTEVDGRRYCDYDYNKLFKYFCCSRCGSAVPDNPEVAIRLWQAVWHRSCAKCDVCQQAVDSETASQLRVELCRLCENARRCTLDLDCDNDNEAESNRTGTNGGPANEAHQEQRHQQRLSNLTATKTWRHWRLSKLASNLLCCHAADGSS